MGKAGGHLPPQLLAFFAALNGLFQSQAHGVKALHRLAQLIGRVIVDLIIQIAAGNGVRSPGNLLNGAHNGTAGKERERRHRSGKNQHNGQHHQSGTPHQQTRQRAPRRRLRLIRHRIAGAGEHQAAALIPGLHMTDDHQPVLTEVVHIFFRIKGHDLPGTPQYILAPGASIKYLVTPSNFQRHAPLLQRCGVGGNIRQLFCVRIFGAQQHIGQIAHRLIPADLVDQAVPVRRLRRQLKGVGGAVQQPQAHQCHQHQRYGDGQHGGEHNAGVDL